MDRDFSIEQRLTTLSRRSRMTSSSNSFTEHAVLDQRRMQRRQLERPLDQLSNSVRL